MKPLTPRKTTVAAQPERAQVRSSLGAAKQRSSTSAASPAADRTPRRAIGISGNDQPTAADTSSSEPYAACCPQCHTIQSSFYCGTCLSERIISHHANSRRVREAQQRAKDDVAERLGLSTKPVKSAEEVEAGSSQASEVPDPFVDAQDVAPLCDLDERRQSVARRAALEETIRATRLRVTAIQQAKEAGAQLVSSSRHSVEQRKAALQSAKSIAFDNEYESKAGAAAQTSIVSRASVNRTKAAITQLTALCEATCTALAHARAKRVREVAQIYLIEAPTGTLANARNVQGASSTQPGSLQPSAARAKRSKERYLPGGLSYNFSGPFDVGLKSQTKATPDSAVQTSESSTARKVQVETAINLNDWAINGLVLPLTGDLRRFPRKSINGALEHLVNCLQLLTGYLGITLPFVITTTGGVLTIRPNILWGSGAKETLFLSSSVYQAAAAKGAGALRSGGLGDMGSSMMSTLGASTMSTFESFVRLPVANQLSWGKMQAEEHAKSDGPSGQPEKKSSGHDDAASSAGKEYGNAFSMLVYDVAYLAYVQGLPVDIVAAAGSPLRLLAKIFGSSQLGQVSHMTHYPESNIGNLVFAGIDFAQLSQIHEPGGSAHGLTFKKETRSSRGSIKPTSNIHKGTDTQNEAKATPQDLDESYIDAKLAAASILDLRQGADQSIRSKSSSRVTRRHTDHPKDAIEGVSAPIAKAISSPITEKKQAAKPAEGPPAETSGAARAQAMQSSLAMERMPGALPVSQPGTLDFLRSRGQRAALPSRFKNAADDEPPDGAKKPSMSRIETAARNAGKGAKAAPPRNEQALPRTEKNRESDRLSKDGTRERKHSKGSIAPARTDDTGAKAQSRLVEGQSAAHDPPEGSARATITFNGKPVQGKLRDKTGRITTGAGTATTGSTRNHRDDDDWAVL